jgi:small-conductance mechanosensitive channel
MAEYEKTVRQAEALRDQLNGLDTAERDAVRQQAVELLGRIRSSVNRWEAESPADSEGVRQSRSEIADFRRSLHDCVTQLELVRTEWADRYRQEIKDGKDNFEKLSEQLQLQMSPEAYRWKRNFGQVTDVMEAFNRFNGQLMDLSSGIEQAVERAHPPSDIGTAERTDRDPAPPANLS